MAFVAGLGAGSTSRAQRQRVCMASSTSPSRRDFLVAAAGVLIGGVAGVGSASAARNDNTSNKVESLGELKSDVEKLKYEDEVLLNPDPAEKEQSRYATKAKDKVGKYRDEEKKFEQDEGKKYEKAVAKEAEDASRLKQFFSKVK